jgi:hypothetical protein
VTYVLNLRFKHAGPLGVGHGADDDAVDAQQLSQQDLHVDESEKIIEESERRVKVDREEGDKTVRGSAWE